MHVSSFSVVYIFPVNFDLTSCFAVFTAWLGNKSTSTKINCANRLLISKKAPFFSTTRIECESPLTKFNQHTLTISLLQLCAFDFHFFFHFHAWTTTTLTHFKWTLFWHNHWIMRSRFSTSFNSIILSRKNTEVFFLVCFGKVNSIIWRIAKSFWNDVQPPNYEFLSIRFLFQIIVHLAF